MDSAPNTKEIRDNLFITLANRKTKEADKIIAYNNAVSVNAILPNDTNFMGSTTLAMAVSYNQKELASVILNTPGVDVNQADYGFQTPLEKAINNGNIEIARLLVEHNAQINERELRAAREYARNHISDKGIQKYIKEQQLHQVLASDITERQKTIAWNEAIADGIDPNVRDRDGNTALHKAAMLGHNTLAERIISTRGFEIDAVNTQGETALTLTVERGKNPVLVGELIANGADVNHQHQNGDTALFDAVRNRDIETAAILLSNPSIDLNYSNHGHTAIANITDPMLTKYSKPVSEQMAQLISHYYDIPIGSLSYTPSHSSNSLYIPTPTQASIGRTSTSLLPTPASSAQTPWGPSTTSVQVATGAALGAVALYAAKQIKDAAVKYFYPPAQKEQEPTQTEIDAKANMIEEIRKRARTNRARVVAEQQATEAMIARDAATQEAADARQNAEELRHQLEQARHDAGKIHLNKNRLEKELKEATQEIDRLSGSLNDARSDSMAQIKITNATIRETQVERERTRELENRIEELHENLKAIELEKSESEKRIKALETELNNEKSIRISTPSRNSSPPIVTPGTPTYNELGDYFSDYDDVPNTPTQPTPEITSSSSRKRNHSVDSEDTEHEFRTSSSSSSKKRTTREENEEEIIPRLSSSKSKIPRIERSNDTEPEVSTSSSSSSDKKRKRRAVVVPSTANELTQLLATGTPAKSTRSQNSTTR